MYPATSKPHLLGNKHRLGKIPWNKGKVGVQTVSDETRRKLSKVRLGNQNRKGKAPWNKGIGLSPEVKRIRASLEYKLWRKSVLERDGYTCQVCEHVGGKLHVHHIQSFARHPELRFEIDNGVTLCISCHLLEHRK